MRRAQPCAYTLTASYAVSELQADVERALKALPESERDAKRAKFAIFVVHNKLKPKLAELPADLPCVHHICAPYARAMTRV